MNFGAFYQRKIWGDFQYKQIFTDRYQHFIRKEWIFKMLKMTGGKKLLDVGCADGYFLFNIGDKPFKERYGVEINKEHLKSVRAANHKGVFVVEAMAEYLPFKSKSMDAIICLEVLEHSEHPEKCISEMKRVSKKYILISVPSKEQNLFFKIFKLFLSREKFKKKFDDFKYGHLRSYTLKGLTQELRTAGIEVIVGIGSCLVALPSKWVLRRNIIRKILFAIDILLGDKPFFRNYGYHTIILGVLQEKSGKL